MPEALREVIDPVSDDEVTKIEQEEACWRQHDNEEEYDAEIAAHEAAEEVRAFMEATEDTGRNPDLDDEPATTKLLDRIMRRIARSRFIAARKRHGVTERTKPRLPKPLRRRLFAGEILHNIDDYHLTRGEELAQKQNKLRACRAKAVRLKSA